MIVHIRATIKCVSSMIVGSGGLPGPTTCSFRRWKGTYWKVLQCAWALCLKGHPTKRNMRMGNMNWCWDILWPVNSCGSQISQLPTSSYPKDPYMKRTLPSGTPAMVVFPPSDFTMTNMWLAILFSTSPMKHVPRKPSHKRFIETWADFCVLPNGHFTWVSSTACCATWQQGSWKNGTPIFFWGGSNLVHILPVISRVFPFNFQKSCIFFSWTCILKSCVDNSCEKLKERDPA